MRSSPLLKKRRHKTVEQRFEDWWKRNGPVEIPANYEHLTTWARCAYHNGWMARTRTKDRP